MSKLLQSLGHQSAATSPRPCYVPMGSLLTDAERAETRILARWTPDPWEADTPDPYGWYDEALSAAMHGKAPSVPTTASAPGKAESYHPAPAGPATATLGASAATPPVISDAVLAARMLDAVDLWSATARGLLWGWVSAGAAALAVAGALWLAPPQWTPATAPALLRDMVAPGPPAPRNAPGPPSPSHAPLPAPARPLPSYPPTPLAPVNPPSDEAPDADAEDDGPCPCAACADVRLA